MTEIPDFRDCRQTNRCARALEGDLATTEASFAMNNPRSRGGGAALQPFQSSSPSSGRNQPTGARSSGSTSRGECSPSLGRAANQRMCRPFAWVSSRPKSDLRWKISTTLWRWDPRHTHLKTSRPSRTGLLVDVTASPATVGNSGLAAGRWFDMGPAECSRWPSTGSEGTNPEAAA